MFTPKLKGKKRITKFFTKLSYRLFPGKVHGFTEEERDIYEDCRQMMVDQGIGRFQIESALRGVNQYVEAPRQLRKQFEKHMGIKHEIKRR